MALVALLGDEVVGKEGPVKVEILADNDIVGIYFSAHWCPPCRMFTPVLAERYGKLRGDGKKFEVVFVSSDKDQEGCDDYYKDMPWLIVPFANRAKKDELSKKYGVTGIPTLVLVDAKTGETVSTNGRGLLQSEDYGSKFPYKS